MLSTSDTLYKLVLVVVASNDNDVITVHNTAGRGSSQQPRDDRRLQQQHNSRISAPVNEIPAVGRQCMPPLNGGAPPEPLLVPVREPTFPDNFAGKQGNCAASPVDVVELDEQHDTAIDARREAIHRQMTELHRQRLLAQAKIDELKRQQVN